MRGVLAACVLALLAWPAGAGDLASLYSAQAVVTGTSAENRVPGARDCLRQAIVRVSGDQRLVRHPGLPALIDRADSLVQRFRYRDRLEGIPIHDEQGTYDRPHDLFCAYAPATLDAALARLGARPWLEERPRLTLFLHVQNARQDFWLASDGSDNPYMRDSLALGSAPLALAIGLPDTAALDRLSPALTHAADLSALQAAARAAGGDVPVLGSLVWSDADLGWVSRVRLPHGGRTHAWESRGISFDEAFRVLARGAAQVLSGHGTP